MINARHVQHVIRRLEAKMDDEMVAMFAEEKKLLKGEGEAESQEESTEKNRSHRLPPAQPPKPPVQATPLPTDNPLLALSRPPSELRCQWRTPRMPSSAINRTSGPSSERSGKSIDDFPRPTRPWTG